MLREVKQSTARDIFLCLFSSIFLILSFPRSNYWILAWVGFVPLFFALQNKSKLKAFFLAYLTGVIFWAGIIYWLGYVTVIGTAVLISYLAVYFGIFGLVFSLGDTLSADHLTKRKPAGCPLLLAALWVILEYLRSHLLTGFPWALLGYSQSNNLPVIQIANIIGAYGVSFLLVMVNVVIYLAISHKPQAASKKIYLSVVLILFFVLGYGYYHLRLASTEAPGAAFKISVVQPNISQELKWDPNARAYILKKYSSLTESAAQDNPDLIVWPEAASPEILGEDDFAFDDIFFLTQKINKPLLIGAVVRSPEGYFNSALLIDAWGQILQRYDKIHLVAFGEYIPLKKYFPFLETIAPIGDITHGKKYVVFEHQKIKFSVLICFEDVFPELSREFISRGADFLINITNDAWYKYSSAAYQHFQSSIFRAVENNTYVIRSANTGVSGFIAPTGRVISLVKDKSGKNIFVEGCQTRDVSFPAKKKITFYTKYGDIFVLACFLFIFYCIIAALKKKR